MDDAVESFLQSMWSTKAKHTYVYLYIMLSNNIDIGRYNIYLVSTDLGYESKVFSSARQVGFNFVTVGEIFPSDQHVLLILSDVCL